MSELVQEIEEMNTVKKKIIRTNKINTIQNIYDELIKTQEVILVLDIDDVVLSSSCYKIFNDIDICQLVSRAHTIDSNRLIFLTSRFKSLRKYTLDQFNQVKLINSNKYINYNIIFAELDSDGNSTKGPTFAKYLKDKFNIKSNTWIIFADDLIENIHSVQQSLENLKLNYTLFHFK